MTMQFGSQPGPEASSQPATPQFPSPGDVAGTVGTGVNLLTNPVGGLQQIVAGLLPSPQSVAGDVVGGLVPAKLKDPAFWKGIGLLAVASVAAIMGLWLWLGRGGQATVVQMPSRRAETGKRGDGVAETGEEAIEA